MRFIILFLLVTPALAQERVLDDFEDLSAWQVAAADGVKLQLHHADGLHGKALRMDFDFQGTSGYAIARRALPLDLPENYQFTFYIRAEAPTNTFEFKLVDPSNENVWWHVRRAWDFPEEWTKVTIKKRHISFAWGPQGGGDLKDLAYLELVVTASEGGRGSVYFDDLTFAEREPVTPYDLTPQATASSGNANALFDDDPATGWQSTSDDAALTVDFLNNREYGGVILDWHPEDFATDYDVQVSADGQAWETLRTVTGGNGGRDYLYLPETDSRFLRLQLYRTSRGQGVGLRTLDVQPLEFAASPNAFFEHIAREASAGFYPKYLRGTQSYWTVIGVDADEAEAMINEEGMVETGRSQFSIEPFLFIGDSLVTWQDVRHEQALEESHLPIPSVTWQHADVPLTVTAWAAGEPNASVLYTRYHLENQSDVRQEGRLFLALRPFQVNPSWQFLSTNGGVARIESIEKEGPRIRVNDRVIHPLSTPDDFGAVAFDAGNVVERLAEGAVPEAQQVADAFGYASGAMAYDFDLAPGETKMVYVAVPLYPEARPVTTVAEAEVSLSETIADWREELSQVEISGPEDVEWLFDLMRSNVAYILINRDGPAIQPGSRSYDRSWIRDGALTSTALLQMGHPEKVREFIRWYAPYQYESGKVPCCVDDLGAGPVPENDSHGQLIYLIAEYYRYTGDTAILRETWPNVVKAVAYMDTLRHQRMTAEYQTPETRHLYGLMPESISHEGYSAKPAFSYWDNLWALRGFKDAAFIAEVLGHDAEARQFAALRDAFRTDLVASINRAMAAHNIDFIPGAADLGDFDATSTTMAFDPVEEQDNLPAAALERTFERYWENFIARRDGELEWDAYTPYEWRNVGALLRLGWVERAHELTDFFLDDARPAAWNHWAEVVWQDVDAPKFIGDMPHTWVGSDFIRAVRNFFLYEREADGSLVVAAGVLRAWAKDGLTVRDLPTPFGTLSYRITADASTLTFALDGEAAPPGGFVLHAPRPDPTRVTVNGNAHPLDGNRTTIRTQPAEVVFHYNN